MHVPILQHTAKLRSKFGVFCKCVGWVVDYSRIDNTSKTKIKIGAIEAFVTDSVNRLDIWLVQAYYFNLGWGGRHD